jgi:hypothetical protein
MQALTTPNRWLADNLEEDGCIGVLDVRRNWEVASRRRS